MYEELIEQSVTKMYKVVFPNTTNHYDTLFGGEAMKLMDEVAFVSATRFSRKKVVTVSTSKVDFREPIPADTIIELVAKVIKVGRTSIDVRVDIFQEKMYEKSRKKSITGKFTFVAIDKDKNPIPVI